MGMSKHLIHNLLRLWLYIRQSLIDRKRELVTASCMAVCIFGLRSLGTLQHVELSLLDQFFHMRPAQISEDRVTIVAIDENSLRDIGYWPIPDGVLANLIEKIKACQPRAIGLHLYRDFPVQPGNHELQKVYQSTRNLVGIELLATQQSIRVLPPPMLKQRHQVGFNNLLFDVDGKVRRNSLYWHVNGRVHDSFAFKLAKLYLAEDNIKPSQLGRNQPVQLGQAIFHRFQANDGSYIREDNRGYQILSNLSRISCVNNTSSNCNFRQISLQNVLNKEIPSKWFKNKIVLIGSTASSIQGFVPNPNTSIFKNKGESISGVELQAYFIDELLSAAYKEKPLLRVWPESVEWLWISAWAYLGAITIWQAQNLGTCVFRTVSSCILLMCGTYILFLNGLWLPVLPCLLTFCGSAIAITYQITQIQEGLKRSKEFLDELINTIPDPIFVKNERHQWIVINDAYCKLIGYPKIDLLEKSEYDFFPKQQADRFRLQDKLVFNNQYTHEHEEKFTNATGQTHIIATKRSVHKDGAGNLFLIVLIRDITDSKLREESLKRKAEELVRSNHELKIQEDHLRYLAYNDPLTGLPNRKYFLEKLQESLEWSEHNNSLLGLLFIDLDGFKQVNDTLGHEMGDCLLVTVAERLNNILCNSDTVARLGGDEFTIILRSIPDIEIISAISKKILCALSEPILLDKNIANISASIGISIYPNNSKNADIMIRQADAAMYDAKKSGKNCFRFA